VAAFPTGRLPVGKGMWLYQLSQAGDPHRVVSKAVDAGLTHLYLRVGSSKMGFYGQAELNALLPEAHAAGLAVVGWDFVYLFDPAADARRSYEAITYTTPDGHRMDAFSADIETAAEGVNLTADGAAAYGRELRALVGPAYPLIATVPRPSPKRWFPFAEATADFDAIAPMVYWMNRDPAADARGAVADLAHLGKPLMPIGQAYDGAPEGGPAGDPSGAAITQFLKASMESGSVAVSFWVWHHATGEQWSAIEDARAWELRHARDRAQDKFLQALLNLHGHNITPDADFGPLSHVALAETQASLGLSPTGKLDRPTAAALLGPPQKPTGP
jgi:hypothetical protein